MEFKSKKWNSIIPAAFGKFGVIGIVVRYDDYFDCYTDTEFNFNEITEYSQEILNSLKYSKLNNRYFANSDYNSDRNFEEFVFEEFARPIWAKYLESGETKVK
jgi:hypothetical protein